MIRYMKSYSSNGTRFPGTVLVDVLVGLALSSMLLALTGSLWLAGTRDLAATARHMELTTRSYRSLLVRPHSLQPPRQTTVRKEAQPGKLLILTNAIVKTSTACQPQSTPQTLICQAQLGNTNLQ